MNKQYITADDLARTLDISMSNAYTRIREMNDELRREGYQTLQGKVPVAFAKTKFYGVDFERKGEEKNNAG